MTLAHRIRMALLLRRANRLAERAKRSRDHLNRPHLPSIHMIGYPVPPQTPIARGEEHSLTFVHALAAALVIGVVVYGEFFHHELAAPMCVASAGR